MGPAFGSGGSFLGTAASTAAGVIGGGLLLNSIRSMFGDHTALAHAAGIDTIATAMWLRSSGTRTKTKTKIKTTRTRPTKTRIRMTTTAILAVTIPTGEIS